MLFLCTPRSRGRLEAFIHSFFTSAVEGDE